VDKRLTLSVTQEPSLDKEERGVENLKYKFRFAPKLLIICINQKFTMGVGLLYILKSII